MPELHVHQTYSHEDIFKLFEISSSTPSYCDNQFFAVANGVVSFLTIGDFSDNQYTRFETPTELKWIPYHTEVYSGYFSFFPDALIFRTEATGKPATYFIFLQSDSQIDQWLYVGTAHLGHVGIIGDEKSGKFHLKTRLSYELWLHFGGYEGWVLEINKQKYHIRNWNEAKSYLQQSRKLTYAEIKITGFDETCLIALTNKHHTLLSYLRYFGDSAMSSRNPLEAQNPHERRFRLSNGLSQSVPASHCVSRKLVLPAFKHFMTIGTKPDFIQWDWEVD